MDDKKIDGLTQDEWCEFIDFINNSLDNENKENCEDENELS